MQTYLAVIEIVVALSVRLAMRMHWTMAIGTMIGRDAIASLLVITMVAIAIIEAR
jgi:hypothetical protein